MRRTIKTTFAIVASAAAVALGAGSATAAATAPTHRDSHAGPAYFEMTDVSGARFVVELTNRDDVEHARELLDRRTDQRPHLLGRVSAQRAEYNRRWGYHVESGSVRFFDYANEACDATIPDVQRHLGEVGGAFLPERIWCDASSRLIRELPNR